MNKNGVTAPAAKKSRAEPLVPHDHIELLTSKEAAVLIKMSESFLAKARMRGDGPRYRKLSRAVRYDRSDLLLWLKASAKTSTAEHDRLILSEQNSTDKKNDSMPEKDEE